MVNKTLNKLVENGSVRSGATPSRVTAASRRSSYVGSQMKSARSYVTARSILSKIEKPKLEHTTGSVDEIKQISNVLSKIKETDRSGLESLISLLLENEALQNALNKNLVANNQDQIDFTQNKTVDDIISLGINFDQLIDVVNNMQVENLEPVTIQSPQFHRTAESFSYPNSKNCLQEVPDLDPSKGVNTMVMNSDNNYLKDLQTQ